jgi:hypothetical protein
MTAEGDAALIVVPDSNVLMNRPANLVRFAELLDSVGSQVVEGQDNLLFTAKILFPFTVTRELDCMKDPRSGNTHPCPPISLTPFTVHWGLDRRGWYVLKTPALVPSQFAGRFCD